MRICVQCEKGLPDENKGYSKEYATPLTGGAQSSIIYYAQLLFYNQYQLKKSDMNPDFQLSMNLGLLQSSATLFEALLDQLLVMGMQFQFMGEDWCADCGQKKLIELASVTGWQKYKESFISIFGQEQFNLTFTQKLQEAISMMFVLGNLMRHGQPLRTSLVPNEEHETIFGDNLGKQHNNLIGYLKKGKVLTGDDRKWKWDDLLCDSVINWQCSLIQSCLESLQNKKFKLHDYVAKLAINQFKNFTDS